MTWQWIAQSIPAFVPLATAAFGLVRRADPIRRRMAHDVNLLPHLPDNSTARETLLSVIDRDAQLLLKRHNYTRDVPMVAAFVVGSVALGYATLGLVAQHQWWAYAAASVTGFLWLVFIAGVFDSAQSRDQEAHKAEKEAKKAAKAKAKANKARK